MSAIVTARIKDEEGYTSIQDVDYASALADVIYCLNKGDHHEVTIEEDVPAMDMDGNNVRVDVHTITLMSDEGRVSTYTFER